MKVELLAYTQANPALSAQNLATVGDLATIWNGQGNFAENLIEYAGRVCYRSTHRMGTAPNFIAARVKEGHEDIIEHVVITLRIRESQDPLRWRMLNRHCEVSEAADGSWIVSGNTRVWLDLLRRGLVADALPILKRVAPKVYQEFPDSNEDIATLAPSPYTGDLAKLRPAEDGAQRVTLLGYTQPLLDDPEWLLHHGSATFLFEGISRACTHQLVRHRLASFSQESQRYVDLSKGGWNAIMPPALAEHADARAKLDEAWDYLQQVYADLRALGIRKEDARFLLPNAAETRIVTTMNFAAWSHFLWLRAVDMAAQWEIRAVGQRVLEMLYTLAPTIFQDHWDVYQRDFVEKAKS
ncbi:MAG: FAD-dependent thymidylate synthase [Caldilineaceae bacterium]|nr:FAD-dependent thymidylate synthase [Caldilineaceae bacterium]